MSCIANAFLWAAAVYVLGALDVLLLVALAIGAWLEWRGRKP